MKEIWKDVQGFENQYKISNLGRIYSKDRLCIDSLGRKRFRKEYELHPNINNGYYRVTLCENGRKVIKPIHRLVAEHFIDNPTNKPQVNHINGNKLDNRVNNLEWVTVQENIIHAYKHGLNVHVRGEKHPNYKKCGALSKRSKKVVSINVETGKMKKYASIKDAEKDGFQRSEVSRACNHKIKQTKGYKFYFEDEIVYSQKPI